MVSSAEAVAAFKALGAMLGVCPQLAENTVREAGGGGQSGGVSCATIKLLQRRAQMHAALTSGIMDIPGLSTSPTDFHLTRGPLEAHSFWNAVSLNGRSDNTPATG